MPTLNKKSTLNKTTIARLLRECAFDPKKDFTMKVVADVGNKEYYISRAIEELRHIICDPRQTDFILKRAISLLALARFEVQK